MKRYAVKMTTPKGEIAVQVGGILILGGGDDSILWTHAFRSVSQAIKVAEEIRKDYPNSGIEICEVTESRELVPAARRGGKP